MDNNTSSGPRGVDVPEPGDDYDEPIAGSEGGPLPFSPGDSDEDPIADETMPSAEADDQPFDPDEEPA
jgi:hypothetical protein